MKWDWEKFAEKFGVSVAIVAAISLTAAIFMILFDSNLFAFTWKIDPDKADKLGSFLGGFLGSMVGLATLLLVYATYRSQKKELAATKAALEKQAFESTFFKLIEIFLEYIDSKTMFVYSPPNNQSSQSGYNYLVWDVISDIVKISNNTEIYSPIDHSWVKNVAQDAQDHK